MHSSLFGATSFSRFRWTPARWRHRASLFWRRTDKAIWLFVLVIGVIIAMFGFVLRSVFADQERRENLAREYHAQNLTCLARNVYYEARGEPMSGQYAVAE